MSKKVSSSEKKVPEVWSWLVCPKTRSRLFYDKENVELVSLAARLAYPIRRGVPVLLVEEARQIDDTVFQHFVS